MRYDEPSIRNPHLEEPTLEAVVRFLLSDNCKRVAVISGAGISAANGIPTYRGAGGLYETLDAACLTASAEDRAELVTPEAVFSRELFLRNPLPCLEMKRDLVLDVQRGKHVPTLFHRFVELIAANTGKLVRVYDQNIDGLMHQCAHLPSHLVRNPHGRVDRAACELCGLCVPFEDFCAHMRESVRDISGCDPTAPATSTPMHCFNCGKPTVKPASVLFGAPLALQVPPELDDALDHVDLLLIAGTSLQVAPINGVPCFVPPHCVRLVLNDEAVGEKLRPMPLEYGPHATRDVFLRGSIEQSSLELLAACGWLSQLSPLALPPRSRRLLGALALGCTMPACLPGWFGRWRRYDAAGDDADGGDAIAD